MVLAWPDDAQCKRLRVGAELVLVRGGGDTVRATDLVEWPNDLLSKVRLEVDHLDSLNDETRPHRGLSSGYPTINVHPTRHGSRASLCAHGGEGAARPCRAPPQQLLTRLVNHRCRTFKIGKTGWSIIV